MEALEYSPVLIFKQQGDQANELCSNLKTNDFLLVIQREFQRDMLRSHGASGQAWKNGIRRHVHSVTQQKHIYHFLRMFLMETNIPTFRKLLAQTQTQCRETAPPFELQVLQKPWAMGTLLKNRDTKNTNMYIKSFHCVLRIVYLQHKHNRRVDYLIYILLRIARDKAFDQLQKLEKGKLTHRICDINKRHKTALSFVSLAVIKLNFS